VGIAFNKKIGVGLFGGEGFIMQRLQGDGWAFLHAGGNIHEQHSHNHPRLRFRHALSLRDYSIRSDGNSDESHGAIS